MVETTQGALHSSQTATEQPKSDTSSLKILGGFSRKFRTLAASILPAGMMFTAQALAVEAGEPIQQSDEEDRRGSLVIVGGGDELPKEVIDELFTLATYAHKKIRLVLIPTGKSLPESRKASENFWRETVGARTSDGTVDVVHTNDPSEAKKPEFVAPLKEANFVWFSGGNQNLITAAYFGTDVQTEVEEVLRRGGVVGGTSAGAAIMSKNMIAGGKTIPVIRPGLGYFNGGFIDQHYGERNREGRLTEAVRMYLDSCGFGIDEETALVVRGVRQKIGTGDWQETPHGKWFAFVLGKGKVHLLESSSTPITSYGHLQTISFSNSNTKTEATITAPLLTP